MEIRELTNDEAIKIIDTRLPEGLFYEVVGDVYIGIDNTYGDAFVEVFKTKEECFAWLREVDNEGYEIVDGYMCFSLEKKQRAIINHYGLDHQLDRLIEESAELIQAISKWKRDYKSENCIDKLQHLIEELGDVKNLIEQVEFDNEYIREGIARTVEYKVNRELDRINRR